MRDGREYEDHAHDTIRELEVEGLAVVDAFAREAMVEIVLQQPQVPIMHAWSGLVVLRGRRLRRSVEVVGRWLSLLCLGETT